MFYFRLAKWKAFSIHILFTSVLRCVRLIFLLSPLQSEEAYLDVKLFMRNANARWTQKKKSINLPAYIHVTTMGKKCITNDNKYIQIHTESA